MRGDLLIPKKPSKNEENDHNFNPYSPGIEDVVRDILHKEAVKTISECDSDRESMYLYQKPKYDLNGRLSNPANAGIYLRGEADLKTIAEKTYRRLLREMIDLCIEQDKESRMGQHMDDEKKQNPLTGQLQRKLTHDGITNHEVQEILQSVRRKTFTDRREMNPARFIPLKHGLLRLKTWEFEGFNASNFFTWKVQGNYDPSIRSLNAVPKFRKFLLDVYVPAAIPTILDYLGYCLYPTFPRQKILVIVGPERMGKGTLARILERCLEEGFGRISLMKLLIPDNKFSLQGIEGKNVLVDTEIKREFKKTADFDVVNSLFGGDPLPLEKKFHAEFTYLAQSKGLLIGNLPLFNVTNMAFLSRLIIVKTKKLRDTKEIANLSDIIFDAEGEQIVTLLLNRLKSLVARDFRFSNELSNAEYADLWNDLADSTQEFIDSRMVESQNDCAVDWAYDEFEKHCDKKAIPPVNKHVFSLRVGRIYPKKRIRENGKLIWAFKGCSILSEIELQEALDRDKEKRNASLSSLDDLL